MSAAASHGRGACKEGQQSSETTSVTRAPETNCCGGGGTCPTQLPVAVPRLSLPVPHSHAALHPERYHSPGHSPLMQISISASVSWAMRPQRSPLVAGLGELPFCSVSTQTSTSGGLRSQTVSTQTQPFLFPDPFEHGFPQVWDTHPITAITLRYPPTENTLDPLPALPLAAY